MPQINEFSWFNISILILLVSLMFFTALNFMKIYTLLGKKNYKFFYFNLMK